MYFPTCLTIEVSLVISDILVKQCQQLIETLNTGLRPDDPSRNRK